MNHPITPERLVNLKALYREHPMVQDAVKEIERLKEIDERESLIAISIKKENEHLQSENRHLEINLDIANTGVVILQEQNNQLKADNAALLEAMKFYADESTYDIDHLDKHGYIIIDMDGGKKARECLSKLGADSNES